MPNRFDRFALLVVLGLLVYTGVAQALPGTSDERTAAVNGASSQRPLFLSYQGACGGWYRDADQVANCCFMYQRPTCDDDGTCICERDDYCLDLCQAANNCFVVGSGGPDECYE